MNHLIEKFADLLVDKKWYFFITLVVISLGLAFFLQNIKLDNSLEVWFLKDDPALQKYNDFKQMYGTDEIIMALVKPAEGIYSRPYIKKIYKASKTLGKNKLIKRVLSITRAPYVDGRKGSLIIEDMVNKDPMQGYNAEALKKRLHSNPLWEKILLNKTKDASILMVEPVVGKDMDVSRPLIIKFIKKTLQGQDYHLAGMGVVYEELNRISLHDSPLFTSLSYLILLLVMVFFFRKLSILAASTITIIFSLFLFMDLFGLFKQSFNMISAILPSLIIILALSDIIHIYSHYDKTPTGPDRLKRTFRYVLIPCLFTSVTTAVGFLSLSSSPMAVLKNFGIFASIGVMLEYIVTVIISAIFLSRREQQDNLISVNAGSAPEDKHDMFDKILAGVNTFVLNNRKKIVVSGGLLIVISIIGITALNVDTYSMGFLLENNSVKKSSYFFEKDYGLYVPLEVRLFPRDDNSVKDPRFLRKLSHLQSALEKQKGYDKTTSIADIVKHLNRVLTDGKETSYRIPDSRNSVAQELLLYELDDDNDLSYFVSDDYSECRLTVRIPMGSSKVMEKYMNGVEKNIKKEFGDEVKITFGGYIPLYVKMMEYVLESQIRSFLIAFAAIFLIMALLFRSLSVVLLGIIPNLLPIFLTLGFMGWFHINLDIATVTIAAIAIGISVDDTIHFIFMYKKSRSENMSVEQAIEKTLATSGKAVILTSLMLILGFSVLVFASVKSVIFMGLLIGVTMLSALLCDLFLLPALILLFSREKKVKGA